jgi:predicted dehydrogenase
MVDSKKERTDKKVKVALVGAGRWSQGWHIPQLYENPNVELVALASGRSVPTLAEQYSCRGFQDIDALLTDPLAKELDGIVIATPHASHANIGLKCIEAGLNVFMEKPMTTDLNEAIELTQAATKLGKIFMVNNTANWRSSTQLATELVAKGEIGEIKHAMVMFAVPLGFLFNDPKQEGWVKPTGTMLGNGLAWGQLAHTFGWLWMVSGLKPKEVFAFLGPSDTTGADVFDSATILCTNGATVSVSGVGTIPGKSKLAQNRLFGTEGMMSYNGSYEIDEGNEEEETEMGEGCPHGCPKQRNVKPKEVGGLVIERYDGNNLSIEGFEFENIEKGGTGPESLQAFVDACLGLPHFTGTTAEIGMLCVATIDAMYRSAKSHQPESVIP